MPLMKVGKGRDMVSPPYVEAIPLEKDDDGMIRVGGTRVTLQTIIYAFRRGDSPEQMVDSFPVLRLADVYAVLAYYLNHRDDMDAYMREQELRADTIRQENETRFPSAGLRERLLARMDEKRRKQS
jgi:uncharacterized protein (DUF433 family)